MAILTCLILLGVGAGEAQQTIDLFAYKTPQEASEQWKAFPGHDTPLLQIVQNGDRQVTQLSAPFATESDLERV